MNKEKTAFTPSSGSLFVPARPPNFTFSQLQATFDPSRVPPEKHPNCASQIVKALTSNILPTFARCNPRFTYDASFNPKRCLTVPAEGVNNNGHDNVNNEYILYVNDIIKSPENEEYLILELLGKGTFGQVIRCIRKPHNDQFAIKVIKNKPAYTNQALTEVKIYKKLKEEALSNEDHIVRLFDYFVFRNHICLVFELLHISLYDLLRLSNFSGFSLKFIGRLTEQIVESMACLERNKIIHCDLKPENVLFADEESDSIKVIDLGSSCFLHNTVYTYIQSRFYRAPEVILGAKYTNKIDSWSLGCMVAEFYLGLPLFPGNSEYDQLKRIIDILGMPEDEVLELGRFKNKFFARENDTFRLKTVEEFEQEQNVKLQPHKKYFLLKRLEDLEMYYNKSKQREKQPQEKPRFESFVHFLKGLLQIDATKRWTASQARLHPFLAGTPFESNWEPLPHHEAIEEIRKMMVKPEEANMPKNPFQKPSVHTNAESYRPQIADKNEEINVINSQTSSNKPKSKLNPKAANFGVPALNLDPQATNFKSQPKGSQSEPNSARNSFRKNGGKDANATQFSYKEENEENLEGQEEVQNNSNNNTDQQQIGQQGGQKGNKNYQGKGNYRDTNNASHNEQFHPSKQHGNYQSGGYQQRQRSNSDQGASENIFFQQNKGKQYQQQQFQQYPPPPQQFQQYPQQYQQYPQQFQQYPPPPQQFQQYPQQYQQYPQQFQQYPPPPQQYQQQYQGNNQFQNYPYNNQAQGMGHHDQSGNQHKQGKKWAGNNSKGSGYKNKYGNANSSQYDEKEELKEK